MYPGVSEWARERLARQITTTPPKAHPRRRRLSLPLDEGLIARAKAGTLRKKQTTVLDQAQSRLLRLPAELRIKVYEELIGREYNIVKIGAYVLRSYKGTPHNADLNMWWEDGVRRGNADRRAGILGLLCSCRVIYTEFIPYIYKYPTFQFTDVFAFFAFTISIPAHRVAQLRHIKLCFRPDEDTSPSSGFPLDYRFLQKIEAKSQLPGWKEARGREGIMSYKWAVDETRKRLLTGLVGEMYVGEGEGDAGEKG